jgi:hypothetical protein
MAYDYRAARDRIFGLVRDHEGKVTGRVASPATMTERVLLLALVEFAPNIEPSIEALRIMTGARDESTVRRLLQACEIKGYLVVNRRAGKRSQYTITYNPRLEATPGLKPSQAESPPTPGAQPGLPQASSPLKQTSKADNKADKEESSRSRARPDAQAAMQITNPEEDRAAAVFDHWESKLWLKVHKSGTAKKTPDRMKPIRARLRDGVTPADLCGAIDAASAEPFYLGQNDRGTPYIEPKTILRSVAKVEELLAKRTPFSAGAVRPVAGGIRAADLLDHQLRRVAVLEAAERDKAALG